MQTVHLHRSPETLSPGILKTLTIKISTTTKTYYVLKQHFPPLMHYTCMVIFLKIPCIHLSLLQFLIGGCVWNTSNQKWKAYSLGIEVAFLFIFLCYYELTFQLIIKGKIGMHHQLSTNDRALGEKIWTKQVSTIKLILFNESFS